MNVAVTSVKNEMATAVILFGSNRWVCGIFWYEGCVKRIAIVRVAESDSPATLEGLLEGFGLVTPVHMFFD